MRNLLIFLFCFLILSCSKSLTSDQINSEVTSLFEKENYQQAEIILKNFLTKSRDDKNARLLLARALVEQGEYSEALSQVTRVGIDGVTPNFDSIVLEAAYFAGDNEIADAIYETKYVQNNTIEKADLIYFLIKLRSSQNKQEIEQLSQAKEVSEDDLGQLWAAIVNSAVNNQNASLNKVIANSPDYTFSSWPLFKSVAANFLYNEKKIEDSVNFFREYTSLRPNDFLAKVKFSEALYKNNNLNEADQNIEFLLKIAPNQPLVNKLKAKRSLQTKDFAGAKVAIEKAISNGFTTRENYLLAGSINFRLKNFEQSVSFLERALVDINSYTVFHKMYDYSLASISEGNPSDSLSQTEVKELEDLEKISILISGYESVGNLAGINSLLSAITIDEDASAPAKLTSTILKNERSENLRDTLVKLSEDVLNSSADLEIKSETTAKLIVLLDLFESGKSEEAVLKAQEWYNEKQNKANAVILVDTYIQNNQKSEALTFLNNNADKHQHPILYSRQAKLLYSDNDRANALLTSLKALQLVPYSLPYITQYSRLANELNANHDVIDTIYMDIENNLQDAVYASMYFAIRGEFNQAIKILTEISGETKLNELYYYTLSNHYIQIEDLEKAKSTATKIANTAGIDRNLIDDIVELYRSLNMKSKLVEFLNTQINRFPFDDSLKVTLARTLITMNQPEDALKALDNIKNKTEQSVTLSAISYRNSGDLQSALQYFNQAHNDFQTSNTIVLLANHLYTLGDNRTAETNLKDFIRKNPKSVSPRLLLATRSPTDNANALYTQVLELEPKNTFALTNLGVNLSDMEMHEEGLELIEQALENAPNDQRIIDIRNEIKSKINSHE